MYPVFSKILAFQPMRFFSNVSSLCFNTMISSRNLNRKYSACVRIKRKMCIYKSEDVGNTSRWFFPALE